MLRKKIFESPKNDVDNYIAILHGPDVTFAAMPPKYKHIYLFENPQTLILEIKLIGIPSDTDPSNSHHLLYFDKLSSSLVKLWFHSSDSSAEIEERYFELGYLKFSETEATVIEKFNSAQHKLINNTKRAVSQDTHQLIDEYLK